MNIKNCAQCIDYFLFQKYIILDAIKKEKQEIGKIVIAFFFCEITQIFRKPKALPKQFVSRLILPFHMWANS